MPIANSTSFYDRFIVDPAHASSSRGASSGSLMPPSFDTYQTSANSLMRSGFGSTADFLRSIDDLRKGNYIVNGSLPNIDQVKDDVSDLSSFATDVSGKGVSNTFLAPQTFDYLNSELARAYGMDRATAYQEALSNTEYQRAVADMQSAGLNPAALFGAGRASGASTFSGKALSSGSGGSGSDKSSYDLASLAGSAVTLLTLLGAKSPNGASVAYAAGNAARSVANIVFD